MNRAHWQALAEQRVVDAHALLQAGLWSAAYHLIGYAVECGLKACILAHVENNNAHEIFADRKFSEKCWTHNLNDLVELAGLRTEHDLLIAQAGPFRKNWTFVMRWNEISRYQFYNRYDAERLYEAVTETTNGVLPWIKTRW